MQGYAVLGLGDVALPGVLAAMCRCFDASPATGRRLAWRGHFPLSVAAYAAGLLLTYTALMLSWFGDQGQVWVLTCGQVHGHKQMFWQAPICKAWFPITHVMMLCSGR